MSTRLRPYKKDADYSYTLGLFPTLELLQHRPEAVSRVLVSSKAADSEGFARSGRMRRPRLAGKGGRRPDPAPGPRWNCYLMGRCQYERRGPRHNHCCWEPEDSGNLSPSCAPCWALRGVLAIVRPAGTVSRPHGAALWVRSFNCLRYYDDFEAYAASSAARAATPSTRS
jgi:TrmH family RNA methyltransferase